MVNLEFLRKKLPPKPEYSGVWTSIYLEPMLASGERLTIAVAARGENGEIKVCPAIRPNVLEAMFGDRSTGLARMIKVIASSLQAHLQAGGDFSTWVRPVSGVTIGPLRQTSSSDLTGLLRQAVSMTASLAALDLAEPAEEETVEAIVGSADDRWPTQFQAEVVRRRPEMERFFTQKFFISEPSKPLNIFFLSDKVALNTGRLIPGRGLSGYLEHNKARMLDLRIAKERQHLLERSHFELVVFRPSYDDPTYSIKQIDALKRSIATLEAACDESRIRVTQVQSAVEAADRLLKIA